MLNEETAHPAGAPQQSPDQTARVRWTQQNGAMVYARNHAFPVGSPVSYHPADTHPSAVEYLLGALGGDLIQSVSRAAARQGVSVYALEASVSGRLNNPLVALGVVGEEGNPGLEEIACTLYVSADAEAPVLEALWQAALAASPLFHTLRRGVPSLRLEMSVVL